MRQRKSESQELTELCGRVAQWRSTGGGRGSHMPEKLWQEAVRVAGIDGLYATAKATRIKYDALKARCAPAGREPEAPAGAAGHAQNTEAVVARRDKTGPTAGTGGAKELAPSPGGSPGSEGARFVTLQVAAATPSGPTTIELVGRQGDRMRVELCGPVDVVSLVQMWWSRP